jgi:hypothetical protein
LVNKYVCTKYGINPPEIKFSGIQYRGALVDGSTIILNDKADISVLLHEIGHKVFLDTGIKFNSEVEEELAANKFAMSEMNDLGMKLDGSKEYSLTLETDDPARLYSLIYDNQDAIGINVKGYNIGERRLSILFDTANPIVSNVSSGNVKYLAPIIWAIIGLAAIFGITITSWQVSGGLQDIKSLVQYLVPIAILGISAWAVVTLLSK